ncbi:MAG TPA: GMC family oxidoreductase N-terminal domain-containing protein [Solirubrobacterales bacterium]
MADAMAPGAGPLPAAAEIDVTGPIAAYVAGLPRRGRLLVHLALNAVEWMPWPWRFSRQDLEARRGFLRDMDRSGTGWIEDLLLFLKVLVGVGYGVHPRVTAALGYETRCEVAEGHEPAAPVADPLGDLAPRLDGEEADVVVIGSGAGGAVAAAVLAEAGLDVIVLEAGQYLDRTSYPDDPLTALESLYRDNGLTIAEGRPAIPVPLGRAVGGTTVINSGTCFRAPDRVLSAWAEEHGIDWADRLDPEYAEAEEMLQVMPVDVERMGRNGQIVMEGAAAIGASGGPISRNAGRCVSCSSCPLGCRLDAKRAMHVSYMPRAVAAGARVRAGVEARELIREDGRVRGVRGVVARPPLPGGAGPVADEVGSPIEVRARAVVLAGGAIGTPELLLRNGIRTPGDQVGRNLHIHPAAWIGGLFDEEVRGWDGIMQSYYVDEWHELGLLMEATFTPLAFGAQWLPGTGHEHAERMLAYDRLGSNGVHLSDASSGRVRVDRRGAARVSYRLTRDDARKLTFGIARAAEIFFAAGATEVYSQIRGAPAIVPGRVAEFEAADPPPHALHLEAFHPMGTARMSADPRLGATGVDGAVHGVDGLYVADASLMPSSLGVNPMMTVSAMSAHVARGLAETLTG